MPVPSHLGMQGAVLLSFTPCVQAACTNPQLRTFEEICFRLYELRPSQAVIIFRCHRRDLLPSGLPHAGTHPNTYTYIASPLPPRLFSLGNFGSSSLDLLCRCLSVPLAELLWALPNFPAFCWARYHLWMITCGWWGGVVSVWVARPCLCPMEIPSVLVSFECLLNLCGEIPLFQHLPPPSNTQLHVNCFDFVVVSSPLVWGRRAPI